jgi:DNA-binding CsgD family transcriptional regulator
MNTLELISSTACAAFTTTHEGRILNWNGAAEELLGHGADDVVGRPCHEVLCGRDVFGNRFCDGACTVHNMAKRGEPVHHFQMDVLDSSGERVRTGLCALILGDGSSSRYQIIHLLQPAAALQGGERERDVAEETGVLRPAGDAQPSVLLTAREMEVLGLLKDGVSTQNIAEGLQISVTTVRNHIQGILRKLGAHSRLEAVSVARRLGIV